MPADRSINGTTSFEEKLGSTLDCSCGNTLDDVLLAQQVENDDGENAEQDQRHRRAEVDGAVAALEILNVNGNGHVLRAVEHEIGQQIVVPHPHDLENTDGDHRGAQHRQHNGEIRAQRAAAVDGGGLFDLKRDRLDKADEHKDRKPRAEAEVDDGDRPRRIQRDQTKAAGGKVKIGELDRIGRFRQREHDHLERHDHGKDAEVVDRTAELAVHARDVPRGHGRAEQDQRGGNDGDEQAVPGGLQKWVVAEGQTLDEVGPAGKTLCVRQGEGVGFDVGVDLEGVDDHRQNRQHIDDANDAEHDGENRLAAAFGRKRAIVHYCCTSFLRLERS